MKAFLTSLLLLISLLATWYFFSASTSGLQKQPMRSAISGWDNSFYYFWLRSAFLERPFDFRQSVQATKTMPDELREKYLNSKPTPTGKLANKYGVGWAVSGVPYFLIADAIVWTANLMIAEKIPRDGYGPIYQYALLLGQLGYAVAGLFFSWRIVRRWVPGPEALQGVLLCWLASFLFVYQTWMLSMAHNLIFFCVAWAYWAALRIEEKKAGYGIWVQLGLACSLAIITRYQTVVYLIFPAWVSLRQLFHGGRRDRLGFLLATIAGSAFVFIQLLGWKIIYGSWIVDSYAGEGFNWSRPQLWKVLFSAYHGLFYWSPALVIGCVGFFSWMRQGGTAGWTWAGSLFATLYINASWDCWWFGASFGSRAFDGCVLFFMLGTAWLLHKVRSELKAVLVVLLLLFGAANMFLSSHVLRGHIYLEKPISHTTMLRSFLKHGFK